MAISSFSGSIFNVNDYANTTHNAFSFLTNSTQYVHNNVDAINTNEKKIYSALNNFKHKYGVQSGIHNKFSKSNRNILREIKTTSSIVNNLDESMVKINPAEIVTTDQAKKLQSQSVILKNLRIKRTVPESIENISELITNNIEPPMLPQKQKYSAQSDVKLTNLLDEGYNENITSEEKISVEEDSLEADKNNENNGSDLNDDFDSNNGTDSCTCTSDEIFSGKNCTLLQATLLNDSKKINKEDIISNNQNLMRKQNNDPAVMENETYEDKKAIYNKSSGGDRFQFQIMIGCLFLQYFFILLLKISNL
ncbi:hypothetical protein COBT_000098 [Conglomerata obtusa]